MEKFSILKNSLNLLFNEFTGEEIKATVFINPFFFKPNEKINVIHYNLTKIIRFKLDPLQKKFKFVGEN
jgi:hypothetical protein